MGFLQCNKIPRMKLAFLCKVCGGNSGTDVRLVLLTSDININCTSFYRICVTVAYIQLHAEIKKYADNLVKIHCLF